jgi:hypothetical protein
MTAEIAILNRQGVALAADSAVTINYAGGPKVYNSVNKLFMLSRHAPVGIMIFGIADLTGVPWETIIKSFRRELGTHRFPHLEDYAASFIAYLNGHTRLFSDAQQERQFLTSLTLQFRSILREFEERSRAGIDAEGGLSLRQVQLLLGQVIADAHKEWVEAAVLPDAPADLLRRLQRKWPAEIDAAISFIFGELPIGPAASKRLREIATRVFTADLFPDNVSGIVVSGFGEDDYFPRLISYDVEGVLLNFLKIRPTPERSHVMDGGRAAAIIPFAQSEMVALFMEGVDGRFKTEVVRAAAQLHADVVSLVDTVDGISSRARTIVHKRLTDETDRLFAEFVARLDNCSQERHINPVLDSVTNLPKEELAAMAEALVSLTSFKRRVTRDPETVGGPIDVAVISKGDGFIWIKRKHYFDPALNHQFFENYYRDPEPQQTPVTSRAKRGG